MIGHIRFLMISVELQTYISGGDVMNNRKSTLIFVAWIVMLLFAACSKDDSEKKHLETESNEIVHYGVDAKTDGFASLNELEDEASIIVKGVRLENQDTVIKKSGENILSAYTFSEIEIKNVYKNSSSQVSEGDVITILENEAFDEDSNIVYHIAGYNMMVEGNEYILFLRENEINNKTYYVSVGVNYGTVSVEEDGRTKVYNTREGNSTVSFEEYENIWEEAREKYK